MPYRGGRRGASAIGPSPNYDDVLVFGYSCKLFRDTERFEEHNAGKHLIACHGDDTHMIDRYDCRLHLHNVDEYEHKKAGYSDNYDDESERIEEEMCEEERYHDLRLAETNDEEERRKRDAARAQIPFSYGTDNSQDKDLSSSDEDTPYVKIADLKVPVGVSTPDTAQQAYIIHKTAMFVADHGTQMEIVIKAKQRQSEKFAFLNWDDSLNQYYKHTLKMIKDGRYVPDLTEPPRKKKLNKPKPIVADVESDGSDSDSDGSGDYLHPSLFAASGSSNVTPPPVTQPNNNPPPAPIVPENTSGYKLGEGNDVYSALFNRISALQPKPKHEPKELTSEEKLDKLGSLANQFPSTSSNIQHTNGGGTSSTLVTVQPSSILARGVPPNEYADWHKWMYNQDADSSEQPAVVPPPPDLAPVVNRAAEFIAKHGIEAEKYLKGQPELGLAFLEKESDYFGFYHLRLRCLQFDLYYRELHSQQLLEKQAAEWNAYYNNVQSTAVDTQHGNGSPVTTIQASSSPSADFPILHNQNSPHLVSSASAPALLNTARPRRVFRDGAPDSKLSLPPAALKTVVPVAFSINKPLPDLSQPPPSLNASNTQETTLEKDFADKLASTSGTISRDGDDQTVKQGIVQEEKLRLERKRKAQMFLEKIMKSKREKRLLEQQQQEEAERQRELERQYQFIGPKVPAGHNIPPPLTTTPAQIFLADSQSGSSSPSRSPSPVTVESKKANKHKRSRSPSRKMKSKKEKRRRNRSKSPSSSPDRRKRKRSRSRSRS